jgi:hypothetical protein
MSVVADAYNVYVDWDDDGSFSSSDAYDDITSYVLSIHFDRGASGPPPTKHNAGACQIVLRNNTSIFSSYNTDSPLHDLLTPGHRVRITMTIGSVEEILWQGKTQSIIPSVGETQEASTAELVAYGCLSIFVNSKSEVALKEADSLESTRTGALVDAFLDACGFPADERQIDSGRVILSKWWKRTGDSDLNVLQELEDAEMGVLREAKNGDLVFEDHHHMFAAPHYPLAQATYGTGTLKIWELQQDDPLSSIYNIAKGKLQVFNHSQEVTLVTIVDIQNDVGGDAIEILPGETYVTTIGLGKDSPNNYIGVYDWTYVDVEVNTAADRTGIDVTNDGVTLAQEELGAKLRVSITNIYSTAIYVVLLRSRGIAIIEEDGIEITAQDADLDLTRYGEREYPYVSKWMTNQTDAQTMLDYLIALYSVSNPTITFKVIANVDETHLLEVQVRDIRDRIHVTAGADYGLYIDDDFIIYHMSHDITQQHGKYYHVMTLSCVKAPPTELAELTNVIIAKTSNALGVPDDIETYKYPVGTDVVMGAQAWKYNETITACELVYKYYAPGTSPAYVDLSAESVLALSATYRGREYTLALGQQGRVYFAYRFRNSMGWSVWSDGNPKPTKVTDYVDTELATLADTGPPESWNIISEIGVIPNTIVLKASRPAINGRRILGAVWQLMDRTTGTWRDIDVESSSLSTTTMHYDGSSILHTVSANGLRISFTNDESAIGFDLAQVGDLVLIDRRQGEYGVHYTNPYTITKFENDNPATATWFEVDLPVDGFEGEDDCRLKIVSQIWEWTEEGYFGSLSGMGYTTGSATQRDFFDIKNSDGSNGDMTTQEFTSPPIYIGATPTADIVGRVLFQTAYSQSDDDTYSTNIAANSGTTTTTTEESDGVVNTDGSNVGNLIRLYFSTDATLANPTNCSDTQILHYCLINTSDEEIIITLGDLFQNGKAFPTVDATEYTEVDGLDIVEEFGEQA